MLWRKRSREALETTLVNALLETNKAILEEMAKISTAVVEASKREPEPVLFSTKPLHISEEEEDIEHLKASGQIDADEYQALMNAAGLLNTEMHFAPEEEGY